MKGWLIAALILAFFAFLAQDFGMIMKQSHDLRDIAEEAANSAAHEYDSSHSLSKSLSVSETLINNPAITITQFKINGDTINLKLAQKVETKIISRLGSLAVMSEIEAEGSARF